MYQRPHAATHLISQTDRTMTARNENHELVVLGAGVIGLSTALELKEAFPGAGITVVAKHFPGDRSIEYTSPWAGANWSSMATDNGPLEGYDRVTFERFARMVEEGLGDEVSAAVVGLGGDEDEGWRENLGSKLFLDWPIGVLS